MLKAGILAKNIKICRKKLGLTQSDLAGKIFVSSQAVSKWESGESVPDLGNLCMLSEIFATSIDKLTGNIVKSDEGKAFIGIDGGATKTEFILFTDEGEIVKRIVLGGCNPNASGIKQSFATLKSGIDSLLGVRHDVAGVFAGISGYFSGNNSELLEELFSKTYPLLNVTLSGDIVNVFATATNLDNCIAVICGTGFSIYCKTKDHLRRVGGWGYLLDDIAGGYGIGRKALIAALSERDGFGTPTLITKLVEEKLGSEVWKNIDKIYAGGDSFIASFAPIVFEAYKAGDKCSSQILESYTKSVADLLEFSLSNFDCGDTVVLAGGLFSDGTILLDLITKHLKRKVNFILPKLPQIYGACYKCLRLYGKEKKGFYENFEQNYNSCVKTSCLYR